VAAIEAEGILELIESSYVVIDDETEEVLVRSFVRHDGLIKTPNIASAMVKDYAGVASEQLRGVIIHELVRLKRDEPDMKGWSVAAKLLSDPSVNPSEIPSPNPSDMGYPIPSGNGSHIPHPSSLIQQPAAHNPRTAEPEGFDAFWATYPKRADKGHARTAWAKAVRKADVTEIVDGARRFGEDPNLPEPKFIPLAATWLNGERWEDGPLPSRSGSSADRQGDLLKAEMARAQAADAANEARLEIGA